ncbi:MAG: UDP-N-acetylmuramoyl-tripeptide--D-alanyl-D-alanine ligase [Prevotellaceae bacterium]|jgi:UDP-N-acetylmuramoyl-tripeptide--D-alanyl-D-alanine ligase|nr:UDP-N-acetylmuramoyl-tripeptide--D-alanyl-D-alanine ligase [Prevotellaceae bacterium]
MQIKNLHSLFLKSSGVCTDSRKVSTGCIFFALKGENFNGNKFAEAALAGGASYAVVDEGITPSDGRLIRVENALKCLQELAAFHRKHLNLPIFAVTGTNGKTTTKELVNAVLQRKYKTVATQGNLNNHIGVPLTLLGMSEYTQLGIVEMGANHPYEIERLCAIAQPNAGLITNVGKAHLEGFGSFEGVKKAKGELYEYLARHDGQVFALAESTDLQEMLKHHRVQHANLYGLQRGGAMVVKGSAGNPFLQLRMPDGKLLQTRLTGAYNAANVLAAVAVGKYYDVSFVDIYEAIETYEPQNHRSQLVKTARNTLIVDAYNANPSSMSAAVASFAALQLPNKLPILGDMLELGESSDKEHLSIVRQLQDSGLRKVYFVGPRFAQAAKNTLYLSFANAQELGNFLKKNRIENNLVLLKGSRGMCLETLMDLL